MSLVTYIVIEGSIFMYGRRWRMIFSSITCPIFVSTILGFDSFSLSSLEFGCKYLKASTSWSIPSASTSTISWFSVSLYGVSLTDCFTTVDLVYYNPAVFTFDSTALWDLYTEGLSSLRDIALLESMLMLSDRRLNLRWARKKRGSPLNLFLIRSIIKLSDWL